MVIGHLGVAFEAKAIRPRAMLLSLIAASFLPDITRALLSPFGNGFTLNLVSHSVPAIAFEAIVAAAICCAMGGTLGDASVLAIVCCTHWPLDVVTGCKATWPNGPVVGLAWYQSPLLDIPIEAGLLLAGWSALKRRMSVSAALNRGLIAGALLGQVVALGVINLETGFFYTDGVAWRWNPKESFTLHRIPATPPNKCPQPGT